MTFAQYLRERRLELGCSQEHLAVRTGLTRQTINRLEQGHALPKLQSQRVLAQALNLSVKDFRPYIVRSSQRAD